MYKILLNSDSGEEKKKCSLPDVLPTIKKFDGKKSRSFRATINESKNVLASEDESESFLENEESDTDNDSFNLKLCGTRKINNSLLTFRIAQFLWYGGGIIPSIFFGIFIQQRGLTLVELSSVFSVIFIFQLSTSSVAGIITDKIGNAKPVLMFLMFSTSCVVIILLQTPHVNSTTCTLRETVFNDSDSSEYKNNFTYCYTNCLLKNKEFILHEENYTQKFLYNKSAILNQFSLDVNNSVCNFFNSSLANVSHEYSRNNCCNECTNSLKFNCITDRNTYVLALYFMLTLAFYSFWNTTYRFMNFTSVSLAENYNSHFGVELAIANSGSISVLIIVAFVLNIDKSSGSGINFDPVIGVSAAIMICALVALSMTSVPILPPGKDLFKKALNLMSDADILAFILMVFVAGTGFAFTYTFRLIFLKSLNASSTLVALHSVSIILYAFPVLITSKWWLKMFGTNKLFVSCLLFYTVNNAAYSYIRNPWWSLIIDTSIVFTHDLFWVAVVMHCWNVAPVGFAATLNAFTGAVHYGMGRSSGVFFGGMLMNYMGARTAYRIMSTFFFVTAILYVVFLRSRNRSPANDARKIATEPTRMKISKNASDCLSEQLTKASALMKVL